MTTQKREKLTQEYVYGVEPTWKEGEITDDNYQSELGTSLYYYSNCISSAKRKQWAIEYLSTIHGFDEDKLKVIPEFYIERLGTIKKMIDNGFVMNPDHLKRIVEPIPALIERFKIIPQVKVKPRAKPDPMLVHQYELLDTIVDNVVMGARSWKKPEIIDSLTNPQLKGVIYHYTQELAEIQSVLDKTDKDLVEAYIDTTERELKRLIKMYKAIITALQSHLTIPIKKQRKKRVIPKSRQVSKLHYMKKCDKLGITSIDPRYIIGAKKLLVFNTNNRVLMFITSNDLAVKGSTLINFDEKFSSGKTIRKPESKLKEFINATHPRVNSIYHKINAVEKKLTGRVNKHCLILKAF
jgi:hypothetical protein